MLIIRSEQIEAFDRAIEEDFVKTVADFVRNRNPVQVAALSEQVLYDRVRYGIARGRQHELTDRSALKVFVSLMFELAPNFDKHPPLAVYLIGSPQDQQRRMSLLLDEVSDKKNLHLMLSFQREPWIDENSNNKFQDDVK